MSKSKSSSSSKTTTNTTTAQTDNRVAATDQGIAIGANAIGDGAHVMIQQLSPELLAAGEALLSVIQSDNAHTTAQADQQVQAVQQQATAQTQTAQKFLIIAVVGVVAVTALYTMRRKA